MSLLKRDWPATVDEAVEQLAWLLTDQEIKALKASDNEWQAATKNHFLLGATVRSNFGLLSDNKALLQSCHREWIREQREEAVRDLTPQKVDELRKMARTTCKTMLKYAGRDGSRRRWEQELKRVATASPEELAEVVWRESAGGQRILIDADTASQVIIRALWRRLRGASA